MNWGNWIRTSASRYQKPLPYRLAIPQKNSACSRLIILHRSTQTGIEPVQTISKWLCINHCTIKFGVFVTKYSAVIRQQRKAWDSNPRTNFTSVTSLARKRHQPLGQLSITDTFLSRGRIELPVAKATGITSCDYITCKVYSTRFKT